MEPHRRRGSDGSGDKGEDVDTADRSRARANGDRGEAEGKEEFGRVVWAERRRI